MKNTRLALLLSSILNEPLACLLIALPFILRKDCHATAWQISLLATLKPIVSLFSFFWLKVANSFGFNHRKSVLISGFLSRVLFLFFPFIHCVEYAIFAAAIYLFFSRASLPSWMELIKLNLETRERQKWFSLSSMFGFAEGIVLAMAFGSLFDQNLTSWRLFFAVSALLGMVSVFFQMFIPVADKRNETEKFSIQWRFFFQPIQEAFLLLKQRKDFALFQFGFMAGGFGIMLINVISPLFFVDVLNLSHAEYVSARYIYMGIGFILFSPLWQKGMQLFSFFGLTMKICLGFALFIVFIFLAKWDPRCLNLAFFIYGMAQAGSHLVWHLSGPEFSNEEDSAKFSAVNLLMVGIRGMIGPAIGSILYLQFGPYFVFGLSFSFCLLGGFSMLLRRKELFSSSIKSLTS